MKQTRLLITGASGMLGATLTAYFSGEFDVYATGNSYFEEQPSNYKKFDLSENSYEELIGWSNPDIIIHCGALTNGNYCNTNVLEAFAINSFSVQKLLNATNDRIPIIYISTDAVFPSELHLAKETDQTNSESKYGKSKELGEFLLLHSNRKFIIVRTTIVGLNINKNKIGFVEWIINAAKEKKKIKLFDDVVFSPISIWKLAEELAFLIHKNQINSEILHITGSESCTKYEFGIRLLEALSLNTDIIGKGSILDFEDRAKRSHDQTMDVNFYQKKYQRKLPVIATTIKEIKKQTYGENNSIR